MDDSNGSGYRGRIVARRPQDDRTLLNVWRVCLDSGSERLKTIESATTLNPKRLSRSKFQKFAEGYTHLPCAQRGDRRMGYCTDIPQWCVQVLRT